MLQALSQQVDQMREELRIKDRLISKLLDNEDVDENRLKISQKEFS